ncbi:hypothetical protein BC834DRAFT_681159 [Gloeopeniophorella convolvens]|nr:hypothetical protein BC834DRAFT_681159 [Gloeopeniophorella convolvens]
MSREDDAPMRPVSAELGVTSDENTSPESSRKRPRPSYLDHSDDEDSNIVGCARSASTTKATTRHQSTEADAEMSDSGSSLTRDEDLEFASRPSKKSSVKPKAGASSDDGLEREYFSPTGVKLEVVELPVKYDTKEWLKHVEQCPDGSKAPWRCTWQTMKNGSPTPCDYSSKKHLVKRHIEATHLCIKRFQCTWCEKTFTQRSNVAGCHLNTHTGAAPHGCDFCDERFKDPSKRHKHMLRCHGYRPGENKKKFKVDDSVQGQSSHESLEPWKVGADRE